MDRHGSRGAGGNGAFAALELLALASGVLFLLALPGGGGSRFLTMAFVGMGVGSGIGWIRAGRTAIGCVVALLRALAVPVLAFALFIYWLGAALCEGHCTSPNEVVWVVLFIGFLVAYFGIPIGSALLLLAQARKGGDRPSSAGAA